VPQTLTVLLDQNVPHPITHWLRARRAQGTLYRTSDVALSGCPDEDIFAWTSPRQAVILTFDEDVTDQRSVPIDFHAGIIRLRIWPTTSEETQDALDQLLGEIPAAEFARALAIIDRERIRIRQGQ